MRRRHLFLWSLLVAAVILAEAYPAYPRVSKRLGPGSWDVAFVAEDLVEVAYGLHRPPPLKCGLEEVGFVDYRIEGAKVAEERAPDRSHLVWPRKHVASVFAVLSRHDPSVPIPFVLPDGTRGKWIAYCQSRDGNAWAGLPFESNRWVVKDHRSERSRWLSFPFGVEEIWFSTSGEYLLVQTRRPPLRWMSWLKDRPVIRVFDMQTGVEIDSYVGHLGDVSPDSRSVAIVGLDSQLQIWDLPRRKPARFWVGWTLVAFGGLGLVARSWRPSSLLNSRSAVKFMQPR